MEKFFEKLFKWFCIVLSVLLVLSSFALIFAMPTQSGGSTFLSADVFGCKQLLTSVENMELNLTSVIYVKDGDGNWVEYQRLHGNENRIWVSSDRIPQMMKDAMIAIEDERFLTHKGVDWKRTFGAAGNLFFKYYDSMAGGSTITQQLIKNVSDDREQNASRKIREIVRALYLESHLSKDQILEAYLNTISFSSNICGVQVAANYYFNKDVSELSVAECATIAAITKHPVKYDPEKNPEANLERRNVVLAKMLELGKITQEQYEEAKNTELNLDLSLQNYYEDEVNNYFVDALISDVIRDLSEKYACSQDVASSMLYNGGYKIYATLDLSVQEKMEAVYSDVQKYFRQTARTEGNEGEHLQSAMTIADYEGHIMGLVGGVGEKTQNRVLNRAMDSPRQPGSTMKPLGVYALALDRDLIHYSSLVLDQPIKDYYGAGKSGPKEWYGYYKGNITVQYALEKSANTVPVRILQQLGVEDSYDFLTNKLHCEHLTEVDKNLASLALGGCEYGLTTTESAAAYAIFGNGGKYFEPTTYYSVERVNGETVLQCDKEGAQVISPETATIMNRLLQQVVYGGEGTGGSISRYNRMKAYAKTGTSSESNDLWMVAGTPYYVGSVWVGFDTPEAISNQGAAATVWRTVMTSVHSGLEYKDFEYSENVYASRYSTATGMPSSDGAKVGYYKRDVKITKSQFAGAVTESSEEASSSEEAVSSAASSPASSAASSSFAPAPTSSSSESSSDVSASSEPSSESEPAESTSTETQGGNS